MAPNRREFIQKLTIATAIPFTAPFVSEANPESKEISNSMNNKIGFNLLAWSAVVSEKLYPMADRLKKIGYDGVECAMDSKDTKAYKQFGNHVQDLGMQVTCVLAVGADENPVSESNAVRQKGLDRIKWAIDRANDMNAKVICGPFHSAFATFAKRPPLEEEYERSADILYQAGEYAAKSDVMLAVEAINRFECYLCNTMDQLGKLVEKVNHNNVKAHFDTHHANIEEKKFKNSIERISPILGHVHISENDRGTPGDGHIPWDETFATLAAQKYAGWLTIEAFTRNDPNFANAINVWREYSDPWQMAESGYSFIKEMCSKYKL
jgi:D-psicose/D-tagatose/L-ribulose 3-epimerase